MNKAALIAKARHLSIFTIAYNLVEGLIAIYFGLEDDSISLLGFGLDSFVEVASAVIVMLKLSNGQPDTNLKHERRATFLIGGLFLVLSLSVMGNAAYQLYSHRHPDTTLPGTIISLVSLSFMFFLWKAKATIGKQLDSATVMADAQCSLACIKLSGILFAGSVVYWLLPALWWLDSVMALTLAVLIAIEGRELIQNSRKEDFKGGCGCH